MKYMRLLIIYVPLIFVVTSSCSSSQNNNDKTFRATSIITHIISSTPTYKATMFVKNTENISLTNTNAISLTITKTNTTKFEYNPIPLKGIGKLKAFPDQEGGINSYFDLDTGQNDLSENSDIEFIVSCGSMCFPGIIQIHGAYGYVFGEKAPKLNDCLANMHSEFFQITPSGIYACFMTNSNNISVFSLYEYHTLYNGSVQISFYYETWKHY
jgi:hypothetical protein